MSKQAFELIAQAQSLLKQAIEILSAQESNRVSSAEPITAKDWTLFDPCMRCFYPGPHAIAYSEKMRAYKATCGRCGKYQKFLNESQASVGAGQLRNE